jgi:hypothetical protein
MVLLNDVVKVLALAESHAAGERAFRFQCFHSRRISRKDRCGELTVLIGRLGAKTL